MADLSVYDQKLQTMSEPMYNPNMHLQMQQEKQQEEDKKQREMDSYNAQQNNNNYNLPTQEHRPPPPTERKQFSYDNLPSPVDQFSESEIYEESELKHIIKVYIIPIIAFIILYIIFSLDIVKHIYESIFSFTKPDMNGNISILTCAFYGLNIIVIFILINMGIQRFI